MLFTLVLPLQLLAQGPNSSYFMKGNFNAFEFNPALVRDSSAFYLALPSNASSINTGGFNLQSILTENNQISPLLLAQEVDEALTLINSNRINLIGMGWRKGKNRYHFSYNTTIQNRVSIGSGIFDLIAYGNAPYVGKTLDVGNTSIDLLTYSDIDFSFSRRINKKLTVGITLKYLQGLSATSTERFNAGITTANDLSSMTLNSDIMYSIASPVDMSEGIYNRNGRFLGIKDGFEPEMPTSLSPIATGFAYGFGAVYKVNRKLELAASIQDIGTLKWDEQVHNIVVKGSSQVTPPDFGLTINEDDPTYKDFEEQMDDIVNEFNKDFTVTESNESFKTKLPMRYYVSANYLLNKTFSVGALYNGVKIYDVDHSAFMGSVNMTILRGISLAGTYTNFSEGTSAYGLGFSFRLAPIQVYVHSDNIQDALKPADLSRTNVRVGANIAFGRKSRADIDWE